MTRITLAHPTQPKIRKQAHQGNAQRFLNAGWTVVDPETDETDLNRILNIAETGAPEVSEWAASLETIAAGESTNQEEE